jgi:2-iminobutanoate/2-iminopropanoate deaminase
MPQRKYIVTGKGLPEWSNPISHAVVANGMCFVSGQLSVGLDGQYIEGTFHEEAERAFNNLFAVLTEAGFSKQELVFVDVAIIDIAEMPAVNELYQQHFPAGKRPARTVAQVAALPFGGKVKLMGTAVHDAD